MALLHAASITPGKAELIEAWLPSQTWAPDDLTGLGLVGAYRFDDPYGEVGLETHLVRCGTDGTVLQVPLTYRPAPLDGPTLITTMQHSVLGERWVYDGLTDPAYLAMLAAVTLTGVGQSAQVLRRDGRQVTRAPTVVLRGGGLGGGLMAVDGFGPPEHDDDGWAMLVSPDLELCFARRPEVGSLTDGFALTGTWPAQPESALLATVTLKS